MSIYWSGYLWNEVSHDLVAEFLIQYQTHPAARKVNGSVLAEFISSMAQIGELTAWTVALIGSDEGRKIMIANNHLNIGMLKRAKKGAYSDRYSIGRLLSPRDESIDLDEAAWLEALNKTQDSFNADSGRGQEKELPKIPSGPFIRMIRGKGAEGIPAHPERGLLILYALDPEFAQLPDESLPVIAFGISFPASNSGKKVEYKVTDLLWREWEQNYGSPE